MPAPPILEAANLPTVEGKPVAVRVHSAAERALRDGHPWLFESAVVSQSRDAPPGEVAVVFDRKNRFLAAGLLDPAGPIRIRLLAHGEPVRIGIELFRTRIQEALGLRSDVASADTTGFRVLHGENDGMPGLIADLYHRTLVLKAYTAAWIPHLRSLVPVFEELLAPEHVLLLVSRNVAAGNGAGERLADGAVLEGAAPDGGVPFLETGLHFEAHPFLGHKTGFYLDQRENRRGVEKRIGGGRVLNVFSYSGAFSVYAARGGAEEVVSVDRSGDALRQARRHFELNRGDPGVASCRHRTLEGDGFAVMDQLRRERKEFDVVIIDPPSFATSASHRERALQAYGRLTSRALELLPPGGLLVQASCTARIQSDQFFGKIHEAARANGRELEEIERTGHPPDHPIGFPEGSYLKCLWATAGGRLSRRRS